MDLDSIEKGSKLSYNEDTLRTSLLRRISSEWSEFDMIRSLDLADRSLSIAKKNGNLEDEIQGYLLLTKIYGANLNQSDSAISFCLKVLDLAEDPKFEKYKGDAYRWMGAMYSNQNDVKISMHYLFLAQNIFKKLNLPDRLSTVYNSICDSYLTLNNLDSALYYANLSRDLAHSVKNEKLIAYNSMVFGGLYSNSHDYIKSIQFYKEALKFYSHLKYDRFIAYLLGSIGFNFSSTGQFDSAVYYASQGLDLALSKHLLKEITDNLGYLRTIYISKGDYKSACDIYQKFELYRDSLNDQKTKDNIIRLTAKFEYDKKIEVDKAMQLKKDLQAKNELKKQKQLIYSLIAGFILLIGILFLIYKNFRNQKFANQKLETMNTELKEMQHQLIQKEKLASLGELTAGIAHEIQNPLNFVNNFSLISDELLDELKLSNSEDEKLLIYDNLKSNLQKIHHHGQRADSIVKGMLQHSHHSVAEKELVNLNALCSEACNLVYQNNQIKKPDLICAIIKDFDPGITAIHVAYSDINRVLINLLENAMHAVKNKIDAKIHLSTKKINDKVIIRIRDNGNGIPAGIKARIFEPFFTTRQANEGTGLGLSISYEIIKAHDGEITVESIENEFTEFIVELPV